MKSISLLSIAFFLSFGCSKNMSNIMEEASMFPKGDKVTNSNFIGTVYVHMIAHSDTTHNINMGNVTFEPGARTNWHYHPGGQILMITEGTGYYQEKGRPIKWMRKGDVIKCPHNVEHWHGASPKTGVTHLAIGTNTNLGAAVWLRPVTDEEYDTLPGK